MNEFKRKKGMLAASKNSRAEHNSEWYKVLQALKYMKMRILEPATLAISSVLMVSPNAGGRAFHKGPWVKHMRVRHIAYWAKKQEVNNVPWLGSNSGCSSIGPTPDAV